MISAGLFFSSSSVRAGSGAEGLQCRREAVFEPPRIKRMRSWFVRWLVLAGRWKRRVLLKRFIIGYVSITFFRFLFVRPGVSIAVRCAGDRHWEDR